MSEPSATPHFLTLRNSLAELGRLADWTKKIAAASGANPRDTHRLDLVLTELVTNTLTHALAPGAEAEIALEARCADRVLQVTLSDSGPAFDPFTASTPALPSRLEDATPGGLGLVLIRNFIDAASYARVADRNRLTLVFRLAPAAGDGHK